MEQYPRMLIFAGAALILIGLLWSIAGKYVPLGRLPLDINIDRPNLKFYFPLGTSIAISFVISLMYILYKLIFRQ